MAAIARSSSRLRLCLSAPSATVPPLALLRYSSASTERGKDQRPAKAKSRAGVRRWVPDKARRFYTMKGEIATTAENLEFLHQYDLEPDNGVLRRFPPNRELDAVCNQFGLMAAFSTRKIIHPYHVHFLDPRGHPLAPYHRAKYAEKAQKPFWMMVTCAGPGPAVVRLTVQRRLKYAVHKALGELGYDGEGRGPEGREIRGTLMLTVFKPLQAVNQERNEFGRVMARALVAESDELNAPGDMLARIYGKVARQRGQAAP